MFLKLTRENKEIIVNTEGVLAFDGYSECGKRCGTRIVFFDERCKPIWVVESPDKIFQMLERGR